MSGRGSGASIFVRLTAVLSGLDWEGRDIAMQKSNDEVRRVKLRVLLVCLGIALAVFLSSIGLGVLYVQENTADKMTDQDAH